MAEQIIIAIGREFGSGGHAIGEKIAKDLGIEFVDRDVYKRQSRSMGDRA